MAIRRVVDGSTFPLYVAEYVSNNPLTRKAFTTALQESPAFPTSVTYQNETFVYKSKFMIASPKQEADFETYCVLRNVEMGVEISLD